ncbi:MAG: AEC family transporter [Alphaproteobacteria bacterium]
MDLINSLAVIFAIIFIGIICAKRSIFNTTQIEAFEIFLFKIALPCYLFNSTFSYNLSTLINVKYIASYFLSFCIIAIITVFLSYKKEQVSTICIKILSSAYINAAIYSLPVITYLLEDPTAAIIGNLLQVIIIQPILITILGIINHKEKSITNRIITSISTPIVATPIVGLLLNYSQINIYPAIILIVQNLGNGASNIALFSFGLALGSIKFSTIKLDKNLLQITGMKNIIHPLIAFCVGKYIFHLEKYWLHSLIIIASAPTAYIVYIISKQFSIKVELVKNVIAISSVISLMILILMCLVIKP